MSTEFHPGQQRHDEEGRDAVPQHETTPTTPPHLQEAIASAATGSTIDRPKIFGLARWQAAVAGVAASAILAGGIAFSVARTSERTEPRNEPGASAPAIPGTGTNPSAGNEQSTAPTEVLPSATSGPIFEQLSPEKQALVEKYHAMSFEEFSELPEDERAAYGLYIIDVFTPRAVEALKKQESNLALKYYDGGEPTLETSGQDIIYQYMEGLAALNYAQMSNNYPYKVIPENRDDAMKGLDALFYGTRGIMGDPNLYLQEINKLSTQEEIGLNGDGWTLILERDTTPLLKNSGGLPAKIIEISGVQQFEAVAVFTTIKGMDGKDRDTWRFSQFGERRTKEQLAPIIAASKYE